jgi:hypothetical protein
MKGRVYYEEDIDLTAFTTPEVQNGLMYILDCGSLNPMHQGSNPKVETDGQFHISDTMDLQDQEGYRTKITVNRGFYTQKLNTMGAVSGGAIE